MQKLNQQENVFKEILKQVSEFVPYDAASIMSIEGDIVQVRYADGDPIKIHRWDQVQFKMSEAPLLRLMANSGEPLIFSDVQQIKEWIPYDGSRWIHSHIGLPILYHDELLGFINLDSHLIQYYTERDVMAMKSFVGLIGIAMHYYHEHKSLDETLVDLQNQMMQKDQKARQNQCALETLLQQSDEAIILADENTKILRTNAQFEHLFAYGDEMPPPLRLKNLIRGHYLATFQRCLNELMRSGEKQQCRVHAQRGDHSYFEAEVSLSIMEDEHTRGLLCSIRDLSSSEKLDEALMCGILEASRDAIITMNQKGELLEFNPMAEAVFGYKRDEIIGQEIIPLIIPVEKQAHYSSFIQNYQAEAPEKNLFFGHHLELNAIRANGEVFPIEMTMIPIHMKHEELFVGIIRDLSAREVAQMALAISEAKYSNVFHHSSDSILIYDHEGHILDVNQQAEYLLDYSRTDLLGMDVVDLYPESEVDKVEKAQALLRSEGYVRFEMAFRNREGKLIPTEVSASLFQLDDQIVSQWLVRDISERQRIEKGLHQALEKERELGEMKSRFITMASHELRTPLSTINSNAEILQDFADELEPLEKTQRLILIQKKVEEITELLEGVLTIDRIDTQQHQIEAKIFDLDVLCDSQVQQARERMSGERLILFEKVGQNFEILADYALLRHVVWNLLSNALKYSSAGTQIALNLEEIESGFVIQVCDEGIGICAEDQANLFQRFYRGKNTTGIPGTGLGLSLVEYAINEHSGMIKVESIEGKGSTFSVYLPKRITQHYDKHINH